MESMAYILERLCSPNSYVSSPDYSLSSRRTCCKYYDANFGNNLLKVLALCDMSLQNSNQGMFCQYHEEVKVGKFNLLHQKVFTITFIIEE